MARWRCQTPRDNADPVNRQDVIRTDEPEYEDAGHGDDEESSGSLGLTP